MPEPESQPDPDQSHEPTFAELNTPATVEIKDLIANLQQSHDLRHKLINMETWALAATMDNFLPGFWSRFLANRRAALKQFLQRKRTDHSKEVGVPESSSSGEQK